MPNAQSHVVTAGEQNQIRQVLIYASQAVVEREVRVSVGSGQQHIIVETQAKGLDRDSLQGQVFGQGEVLGLQHREQAIVVSAHPEVAALEEQKENLNGDRAILQKNKDRLDKQRKFLDSVAGFAKVEVPAEIKTQFPNVDNLSTLLKFLNNQYEELDRQSLRVEKQLHDLDQQLEVVNRSLGQHNRPAQKNSHTIEVIFQSERDQDVTIRVSYIVPSASWSAIYKLQVPEDHSRIVLQLFAQISQNTGEDWNDVELLCTNMVPVRNSRLPDPQSWYLYEPRPPRAIPAMPVAAAPAMAGEIEENLADFDDLMLEEAGSAAEPEPAARYISSEKSQSSLACEYKLPFTTSIKSGERQALFPLETKALSGTFYYYCVPGMSNQVFLVSKVTSDHDLMAGRLNLHYGQQFVGSTQVDDKKAGEDLLLNLGIDRQVRVQRKIVTEKQNETLLGMMDRQNIAREMALIITVENLKDDAIEVELYEAIPVPQTDKISIKGLDMSPAPLVRDHNDKSGVMQWRLNLAAKSTQEIKIQYYIRHPKGFSPAGL
ncbi:MAG: mucoidy inhibitor MuiA family protein [Pseudomonadales bacterium]|nr:mucoidy inhibitor MuiA family protein [Pseudomonadales bacterium]